MVPRFLILAFVASLPAIAGSARSLSTCVTVRKCLDEGDALMKAGNYDGALARYQKGCSLETAPRCKSPACRKDWAEVCGSVGHAYQMKAEPEKAVDPYVKGCDLGSAWACANGGTLLIKSGKKEQARTFFQRACDAGRGDGCVKLSQFFVEPAQKKRFLELNDKGCKLGDLMGCNNLGVIFLESGDEPKALSYYKMACEKGHPGACRNLAQRYQLKGETAAADKILTLAIDLSSKRCKAGYPKDCEFLRELEGLHAGLRGNSPARKAEVPLGPAETNLVPDGKVALPKKELFKRLQPAVVLMEANILGVPIGLGAGFFVSNDGYLLTNYHVVRSALEGNHSLTVRLHDGAPVDFGVVKCLDQRQMDICLLQARVRPKAWFNLKPRELEIGEEVSAIGHPRGFKYSLTSGMLSGVRDETERTPGSTGPKPATIQMVQISTPLSPGNSGGPIFDEKAGLMGMATAVVDPSSSQNLNLGISVNELSAYARNPGKTLSLEEYRKKLAADRLGVAAALFSKVEPIAKGADLPRDGTFAEIRIKLNGQEMRFPLPADLYRKCSQDQDHLVRCGDMGDEGLVMFGVVQKGDEGWRAVRDQKVASRPTTAYQIAMAQPEKTALLEALPSATKAQFWSKVVYQGCRSIKPSAGFPAGEELCQLQLNDDLELGAMSLTFFLGRPDKPEGVTFSFWARSPEYRQYFHAIASIAIQRIHPSEAVNRQLSSNPTLPAK